MLNSTLINLPSALKLSLFLSLSTSTTYAKPPFPNPSPEAHTDLICHTQHASECYPAIFQPTIHFKPLHNDQILPPGLHVRMNFATGLKEARLNVPEPEDTLKADLVIIDDVIPPPWIDGPETEEVGGVREQEVPKGSIYDQSNPVRDYEYRPDFLSNPEESTLFTTSLTSLLSFTNPTAKTLTDLSTLTDLCHSHHWGLNLAQNASLIQKLLSIVSPSTLSPFPTEIRSAAALLLGTALQNNPEARSALLESTNSDDPMQETAMQAIHSTLRERAIPTDPSRLHTRTLFLLHQLSYSPPQKIAFLFSNGLQTLHTLFAASPIPVVSITNDVNPPTDIIEGALIHKLRQRIANFILDHVLPALDGENGERFAAEVMIFSENLAPLDSSLPEGKHTEMARLVDLKRGDARVKILESWSEAFGTVLGDYAVFMLGKDRSDVSGVYAAYHSIREATLLLEKILGID